LDFKGIATLGYFGQTPFEKEKGRGDKRERGSRGNRCYGQKVASPSIGRHFTKQSMHSRLDKCEHEQLAGPAFYNTEFYFAWKQLK